MAGEIIKGTVNIATYNEGLNEIANVNSIDLNADQTILDHANKLLVEQGKSFQLTQVRFDAAVTAANVVNIINDRINEWINSHGTRYDDFKIVINPSGANHDITTVIIRYYS